MPETSLKPQPPIIFIQPGVLQRLSEGAFVPERRPPKPSLTMSERRDSLSPLSVTKRCVRYDPNVFINRKAQVSELAESLNRPDKKLLLLSGPQGAGKTSLARGLIELMGGGAEQLLWFDTSTHTDFDDIIHFLIQYITYICAALRIEQSMNQPQPQTVADPLLRIEQMLGSIAHVPLLIVLDNVEHIVDGDFRINSFQLKEMLNFLLSFQNIKMVLAGERLPYTDLSANAGVITEVKLAGLSEPDVLALFKTHAQLLAPEMLQDIYRKTHGEPWLLKLLFYLSKPTSGKTAIGLETLHQVLSPLPADVSLERTIQTMTQFVYDHLSEQERQVAQVLSLLRHPADFDTIISITRFCQPSLIGGSTEAFRETLDRSLFKPLMKRTFPPQSVLEHIRDRHQPLRTFHPWYEFYRHVKKEIYARIDPEERYRIHALLSEFYTQEKAKPQAQRLYRVKTTSLTAEARFHAQSARQRRPIRSEEASLESRSYSYSAEQLPHEKVLDTSKPGSDTPKPVPPSNWRLIAERASRLPDTPQKPDPYLQPEIQKLGLSPEEVARLFETQENQPTEMSLTQVSQPVNYPENHPVENHPANDPLGHPTLAAILKASEQALARMAFQDAAELLLEAVHWYASHGRFEQAEATLKRIVDFGPNLSPGLLGSVYREWAQIHHALDKPEAEKEAHQNACRYFEAQGVSRSADQTEQYGKVLKAMADLASRNGHTDGALSLLRQRLRLFQQAGMRAHAAEAFFTLAQALDELKQTDLALQAYQEALNIDKQQGNALSCAAITANMASIYADRGQWQQSVQAFEASYRYDQQAKNEEGQLETLMGLADVYFRQAKLEQVEATYQNALRLAIQCQLPLWKTRIYRQLGLLYRQQQRREDALEYLRSALLSAPTSLPAQHRVQMEDWIEELRN
ncbi:MAG: tetratricopeptide repeat protein [Cyanobacteria bacterium]|nr:tetratricopeptide repeat protein [Cyanobacteriota bacterium]